MDPRKLFLAGLAGLVLLYFGYGLERFSLGVDLTDEGAHVAWPAQLRWGGHPFSSELNTLTRPAEVYLGIIFKLRPATTLYEFRLLGWSLHLLAFAVLALYLFRLSGAPGQSLLVASIPVFACNIFSIASPNYNTLSSDFLLLALCATGLARGAGGKGATGWALASGAALFVATLAHPALGVIGAVVLARELLAGGLVRNLASGRPSPSNLGVLAFVAAWALALGYGLASGALAEWWQRIGLVRANSGTALHESPLKFFLNLAIFPFALDRLAVLRAVAGVGALVVLQVLLSTGRKESAARWAGVLGVVLVGSLIATFSYEPQFLQLGLAFMGLVLIVAVSGRFQSLVAVDLAHPRWLMGLSGLGAVLYAGSTYYFSPVRSWTSGILGLPFVLGVGLVLLFQAGARLRLLASGVLALAVVCVAVDHHRFIWRDADIAELSARSHIPKLRSIRSTPERMQALDAVYDYLQPKLAPGEPLLAYDNCPMFYFLLDARPAYGLAWATRFGLSDDIVQLLNRELNARPLPRYAIRALVDPSYAVWQTAPRADFSNYPLNATVLAHYTLDRTFFPFEIWRLNAPGPAAAAP